MYRGHGGSPGRSDGDGKPFACRDGADRLSVRFDRPAFRQAEALAHRAHSSGGSSRHYWSCIAADRGPPNGRRICAASAGRAQARPALTTATRTSRSDRSARWIRNTGSLGVAVNLKAARRSHAGRAPTASPCRGGKRLDPSLLVIGGGRNQPCWASSSTSP
jgi:hypothetical protein